MSPNIGLNITCNTNCSHWCPRILRIFCCCQTDEKQIEKVHRVANPAIQQTQRESDSSCEDLSSFVAVTPEKEEPNEGQEK